MIRVRLEYYDKILGTPALKLLLNGWHELSEQGVIGDISVGINWDHKAIVAFGTEESPAWKDDPVGVLGFQHFDWANYFNTTIAWVTPALRRHGVHTQMWEFLILKAQELKVLKITSSTHVDNLASQKMHNKQGRPLHGYSYEYCVPKVG